MIRGPGGGHLGLGPERLLRSDWNRARSGSRGAGRTGGNSFPVAGRADCEVTGVGGADCEISGGRAGVPDAG